MCRFGAVVQAEFADACQWQRLVKWKGGDSPFATLALEREKVELMTEGHLAVSANGFDIGSGHFGVGLL